MSGRNAGTGRHDGPGKGGQPGADCLCRAFSLLLNARQIIGGDGEEFAQRDYV